MAKFTGFRRYPRDGYIAGVCAGIAAWMDWPVKWIRVLAVLTLIFGGGFPIVIVYGALWYLMDEDTGPAPYRYDHDDDAPKSSRSHYRSSRYGEEEAPRPRGASMEEVKTRFARMEARLRGMEECVASNDFELRRELKKLES